MPHGVLFRGNREAAFRRNLVKRGWIKGVIGLPTNLISAPESRRASW